MPDTMNFLMLGLVVALGTMGFYSLSIVLRARNAVKDIDTLRSLED